MGKEQEESGLCHAWIENVFCVWFQGKFRRDGSEHDLESSLFISFFQKQERGVYQQLLSIYLMSTISYLFPPLLSPLIITLGLCYTFRRPRTKVLFLFFGGLRPRQRQTTAFPVVVRPVFLCPVVEAMPLVECFYLFIFFFLVFFSRHFSAQ